MCQCLCAMEGDHRYKDLIFDFAVAEEDSRLRNSENENSGQNESDEGALDSTEGGINSTVTPTVEDLVTEDALQKTTAMWILKAREQH